MIAQPRNLPVSPDLARRPDRRAVRALLSPAMIADV